MIVHAARSFAAATLMAMMGLTVAPVQSSAQVVNVDAARTGCTNSQRIFPDVCVRSPKS